MLSLLKGLQMRSLFRIFIICANIIIVLYIISLYWSKQEELLNATKRRSLNEDNDFKCHYLKGNEALPVIDRTNTFPENSIFFIESSCKGLSSRQACSVESAARAHPNRQVNVLFTSPVTWDKFKGSAISTLLEIDNVEAARIHLDTYAEETPLYDKFRMAPLTREDLNMELGEILKYLTIYKYNGIYLALDVIVARSFEDLKSNWVVKQSPASMSSDMFSFSNNLNGRTLADIALNLVISDLGKHTNHAQWSFDGATVMKKLVTMWCFAKDIKYLTSKTCPDIQVLEPENFYPISIHDRLKYFQPGDWAKWKERKIYTYQFLDRFTKYVVYNKESLYAQMAKEYCPIVYHFYGERFATV